MSITDNRSMLLGCRNSMKKAVSVFLIIVISGWIIAASFYGQERQYKVVFWNIENFFDTFYNEGREDGNFTPFGEMRWTKKRLLQKRNGIAKVIIGIGGGEPPAIVGFAEVENRYVLNSLINETPLAQAGYSIIHKDSPDRRGIDVAMIYRRALFTLIRAEFVRVILPDTLAATRDILYAKGIFGGRDTLHIFVNHWPSKFGGAAMSEPGRRAASNTLRDRCDSILDNNKEANIVVMGDFNDTPDAMTITILDNLANLSFDLYKRGEGSIKYRGAWELIDQILVSRNLLKNEAAEGSYPLQYNSRGDLYAESVSIYSPPYLLERDATYSGVKPKRTYIGPRYNGGLSDHLPTILSLKSIR